VPTASAAGAIDVPARMMRSSRTILRISGVTAINEPIGHLHAIDLHDDGLGWDLGKQRPLRFTSGKNNAAQAIRRADGK